MRGFENYLLLKGLSPTTIRDSILRVKRILGKVKKLNNENIQDFIIKQKRDGRLNNGINVDIKALKHYIAYIKLDGITACSLLPENATSVGTLSDEEITDFLASEGQPNSNFSWRVFWLLAIHCGMRCGEISRLKAEDINFGAKVIELKRSKTGPREVVIPDIILPELQVYVDTKKDWLFPGNGKNVFGEPVVIAQSWGYDFHSRVKRMKHPIKRRVTPHCLRHSYATRLLNNGAEITVVQRALGHHDLASTAIYRNVCIEDVRRMIQKFDSLVRSRSDPHYMLEYVKDMIHAFGFEKDDRFDYELTESGEGLDLKVKLKSSHTG